MADLDTTLLLELSVQFHDAIEPLQVGDGGRGERMVAPAAGGTFKGPYLRGEVLEPFVDFITARPDGVNEHDIRATLRTDDGAMIYIEYRALGHREPLGPLSEATEPRFYFRSTARFETGDERYAWLNRILAVGRAHGSSHADLAWTFHAVL